MRDPEGETVGIGSQGAADPDPMYERRPGTPRTTRSRGRIVVLGAVAVVLAAVVIYMASGAGSADTGGITASPQGDPIAVLDSALAAGRPVYILAHSAT